MLLSVLLPLSSRHSAAGRFFMRFAVRSAVLSYIAVVAIVNVLLLRHLQELHGLDALNERIFHYAVPALFLIYWLLLDERTALPWRLVTTWMLYPGAYVAYVLVRGALIHRYPYPFIDVTQLGYRAAVINGLAVLVGFAAISFLVVALNRTLLRRVTSP